jgi:hypothetical protein
MVWPSALTPNPSLERTATGYATWPFQGQSLYIVPSRAKRLRR